MKVKFNTYLWLTHVIIIMLTINCKTRSKSKNPQDTSPNKQDILPEKDDNRISTNLNWDTKITSLYDDHEANIFLQKKFKAKNAPSNIFFIFFDTLRRDYLEKYAPNMKAFIDQNITPSQTPSVGTATWYSVPSIFHSMPAHLVYRHKELAPKDKTLGAFPIKVLKQLGYKINLYGIGFTCNVLNKADSGEKSWYSHLEYSMGKNISLADNCQNPNLDFETSLRPFTEDGVYYAGADSQNRKIFVEVINETKKNQKNFFFFGFYNVHSPYSWPKDLKNTEQNSKNGVLASKLGPSKTLVNSYINAVKGSDYHFKIVLDAIKKQNLYDDSLIVLVSDHGELLGEKLNLIQHGGRGYRERIDSFISMKLPLGSNKDKKSEFMSQVDIFPSLFDYMELDQELSPFLFGSSIFDPKNIIDSTLSSRSSGNDPTREMILINDQYKFYIKVDEEDFYNSSSFRLFDITNLDDRPVLSHEKVKMCVHNNKQKCKEFIRSNFKSAMNLLYK